MSYLPLPLVADPTARPCGSCTACCTVLGVKEPDKPPHTACVHLTGSGCGQYETRPRNCRRWSCLWAQGQLAEDPGLRPDRLGLVLDVVVLPGTSFIAAYEVWPGAGAAPAAVRLLEDLGRGAEARLVMHGRAITRWPGPA